MAEKRIDLTEKFPDLEPISSPPSLFRLNGCGSGMYGRRDFDGDTQTYAKTLCLCLVFIPVLALRAYRVADARQGWYFIGREPLSGFAKMWNYLLASSLVGVIAIVGWASYAGSPAYLDAKKLQEADRLAESGQLVEAATKYRGLIEGESTKRDAALERFAQLVAGRLPDAPIDETTEVVRLAMESRRRTGAEVGGGQLFAVAFDVAKRHRQKDPRAAFELLEAVKSLAPKEAALARLRFELLEAIVTRDPQNTAAASELAVIYEQRRDFEKCEQLLTPHADRLADHDGARILGQILAAQGKFDEAQRLLLPYVEKRLDKLHAAEKSMDETLTRSQDEAIKQLNNDFDFRTAYEAAGEAEQEAMVQKRVLEHMQADRQVMLAQQTLREAGAIVPVALDLGMVILRRAQSMDDPDQRRSELEKAEKMFLAVRGQAGEQDEFRLSLGQVYYWLGKHHEGRKLFDELLEANARNYETLMSVSLLLREVGERSESRTLVEEAYRSQTDENNKQAAALMRSLLAVDLDDRITWLQRADRDSADVRAALSDALGNRAVRDGDDEAAVRHLADAIREYAEMPENASTLNNGALAHFALFGVTGQREDLDEGLRKMERAIELSPSDSILVFNTAGVIYAGGVRDVIGNAIDLRTLKLMPGVELLSYLYVDESTRKMLINRVSSHAVVKRAVGYMDQAVLLAPKRRGSYESLADIHRFTRDVDALRGLVQRLQGVQLDLADETERMTDFYAGKKDEAQLQNIDTQIARYEQLVKTTREGGGATFAVAVTTLVKQLLAKSLYGEAADADRLVQLAREAHAAAPSESTLWTLVNALGYRGSLTLAGQNARFDRMVTRAERSLWRLYVLAIAIERDEELRRAAAEDADLQRVGELLVENHGHFPGDGTPLTWALLRHSHPDEAARIAENVRQDEVGRLKRELDRTLSPLRLSVAFDVYWALLIEGREAEAQAVLRAYFNHGVPLPFDPGGPDS